MGLSLKEVLMLVLSRVEGPVLSRACPELVLSKACPEPCRRVEGPSRRVEGLIDVN